MHQTKTMYKSIFYVRIHIRKIILQTYTIVYLYIHISCRSDWPSIEKISRGIHDLSGDFHPKPTQNLGCVTAIRQPPSRFPNWPSLHLNPLSSPGQNHVCYRKLIIFLMDFFEPPINFCKVQSISWPTKHPPLFSTIFVALTFQKQPGAQHHLFPQLHCAIRDETSSYTTGREMWFKPWEVGKGNSLPWEVRYDR